jgi:hypothetical protein
MKKTLKIITKQKSIINNNKTKKTLKIITKQKKTLKIITKQKNIKNIKKKRISETSIESFIIRVFREHNSEGLKLYFYFFIFYLFYLKIKICTVF